MSRQNCQMQILVLGSGGREHAIELKLAQSDLCQRVITCPGNGGTNSPLAYQSLKIDNFDAILNLIKEEKIDLVFIGPEIPLTLGLKDFLNENSPNTIVFGPNKTQAQLEASKIFSYELMEKCNIPQAKGFVIENLTQAKDILKNWQGKVVIKANGLAAGKGVSIHSNREEALEVCQKNLSGEAFGNAGKRLLFQEFLEGTEASVFAICNGEEAIYLPIARDYKPAFDNNQGPNTGGMGSYCPSEIITTELLELIDEKIIKPVLSELKYRGLLYCGLIVHEKGDFSVIEFNCRFGDPETQVVMPMLETDFLPYLLWSENKEKAMLVPKLKKGKINVVPSKPGYCLNVVLSAKGYPNDYKKELPLKLPNKLTSDVHIIHAGTKLNKEQKLVSNGGRILNVVGSGKTKKQCQDLVYPLIKKVVDEQTCFHFRHDIGNE